ncbi:unnamed protein product [Fraxinus pennsylvanica]|uniref:Aluminum-activated malate transporter n=1 Tax=Fraxinus pennsylvanica TaxID=56036 RepID=A0AAD1ZWK6_9LAMI|nr:unnamed protein product [Fraxinus pennsylvanica]
MDAASEGKKLGIEDQRRIIHSLKVGLATTLASLFYYFNPMYQGFGVNAMWAVITVVVVFEFSERRLDEAHQALEHIASAATFVRFYPKLKTSYDYGFLVFILTLCLICVSGYRDDEVLEVCLGFISTLCLICGSWDRDDEVLDMTHKRLSTILISGGLHCHMPSMGR